jgi:hypothetical protein
MTETTANPPGNPEALVKFNRGKNRYFISPGIGDRLFGEKMG